MSTTQPLNVLLITSDQQHYDTLGATNPRIRTPALDRLGREGTRFDRAYCPNPTCSPTRASLITGLYPSAHGCYSLGTKLLEDVPTVGDVFGRSGYRTSLIGKAHFQPLRSTPEFTSLECQPLLRDLDFWRKFHGPWYGFEHVETARMHGDESHAGQHYALWLEEQGLRNWQEYFEPWPPAPGRKPRQGRLPNLYFLRENRSWKLPERFHPSCWVAERTVAQIEDAARAERPFFIWSSFFDPHPPYIVPEPWASLYRPEDMAPGEYMEGEFDHMPPHFRKTREQQPDFSGYAEPGGNGLHGCHSHLYDREELRRDMACYYGMMSLLDREAGRILERLDALGLAERTLVVFTSDHGHFLGQHGLIAKGPFHYQDLLRVPLLVRLPGRVPAGRVSTALQSLVDCAPTFLGAAGVPIPGRMQGRDQFGVWLGDDTRAPDHVLVEDRHNPTRMHLKTYIEQRYRLTVYRHETFGELFDLETDPGERRNRWDDPAYAPVKAQLLHRLVQADMQAEATPMPRIAGA